MQRFFVFKRARTVAAGATYIRARGVAIPFVLGVLLFGCGAQGEGQRCSNENGNADCVTGLVCDLRGGFYLCCPQDPRQAADPKVCGASGTTADSGGGDTGGSGDADSGDTRPTDTATDTATDGAADSAGAEADSAAD